MKLSLQLRFKALAATVHRHQLPIDRKQTQQLLNILNKSFQKQLDISYPLSDSKHVTDNDARSQARIPSSQTSAATLIGNIILSPLFTPTESIPEIKHNEKFRLAVAAGDATLKTADDFLYGVVGPIHTLRPINKNGIKASKAGSSVTHWLWSSDSIYDREFHQSKKLLPMIIAALLAEDRQDLVKHWLTRALPFDWTPSKPEPKTNYNWREAAIEMRRTIISTAVTTSRRLGGGINNQLVEFFELVQTLREDLFSEDSPVKPSQRMETFLSMIFLSVYRIARSAANNHAVVDVNLYDSLMKHIDYWFEEKHPRLSGYCLSLLKLHHPLTPDVEPAWKFIRWDVSRDHPRAMRLMSERGHYVLFFLDIAQKMVELGRIEEATWIVKKLKSASTDVQIASAEESETNFDRTIINQAADQEVANDTHGLFYSHAQLEHG